MRFTAHRARPSPELRLLLALSRAFLRGSPPSATDLRGIDWERFLNLADLHGLAACLYPLARTLLPADAARALEQRSADTRRAMLLLAAELARLSAALADAGIHHLALKGPTLALAAYGDLTLRASGDLDILVVDPGRVLAAEEVLVALGYRRTQPIDLAAPLRTTYLRHFPDFGYTHEGHGVVVELHWRWSSLSQLLLAPATAWARRRTCRIAGTDVPTLAPDDLLLYLCAHGAKHAWFRLFWLTDLPLVARLLGDAEAKGLWGRARELGVERALAQAQWLLWQLLSCDGLPPDPHRPGLKGRRDARSLARYPLRIIQREIPLRKGDASRVELMRFTLHLTRLYPGWSWRLAVLSRMLLAHEDWAVIRLPERWFFLYPVLRPVLWAVRRWRDRPGGKLPPPKDRS